MAKTPKTSKIESFNEIAIALPDLERNVLRAVAHGPIMEKLQPDLDLHTHARELRATLTAEQAERAFAWHLWLGNAALPIDRELAVLGLVTITEGEKTKDLHYPAWAWRTDLGGAVVAVLLAERGMRSSARSPYATQAVARSARSSASANRGTRTRSGTRAASPAPTTTRLRWCASSRPCSTRGALQRRTRPTRQHGAARTTSRCRVGG